MSDKEIYHSQVIQGSGGTGGGYQGFGLQRSGSNSGSGAQYQGFNVGHSGTASGGYQSFGVQRSGSANSTTVAQNVDQLSQGLGAGTGGGGYQGFGRQQTSGSPSGSGGYQGFGFQRSGTASGGSGGSGNSGGYQGFNLPKSGTASGGSGGGGGSVGFQSFGHQRSGASSGGGVYQGFNLQQSGAISGTNSGGSRGAGAGYEGSNVRQSGATGVSVHPDSQLSQPLVQQISADRQSSRSSSPAPVSVQPPPSPKPAQQYLDYARDRNKAAGGQPYAYDAAHQLPPGLHKQYGTQVPGQTQRQYPVPSQLGQSASGYSQQHPSEANLPGISGRPAVYGTHVDENGNVMAVYGPAEYHHYYTDWHEIGMKYKERANPNMPLPVDECEDMRKYGFEFKSKIGQGGFGAVWLVQTTRLYKDNSGQYVSRDVACKVLSLSRLQSSRHTLHESVHKLLEEALIHKDLRHKNIVECGHVFCIHDPVTGFPYCRCLIFMELCDGGLYSALYNHPNKRFNEREAYGMFKGVTAGLKYLHDQNIVHLDLKIDNVLYVNTGANKQRYKLADFGLTRQFAAGEVPQTVGQFGTVAYFPPEMVAQPQAPLDAKKIDIYGCGCILAESLAPVDQFKAMLHELRHSYSTRMRLSQRSGQSWGILQECRDLLVSMTDPDPAKRPDIDQVRASKWFVSQRSLI